MILPSPLSPFSRIKGVGESITVDVSGNHLVLLSGDITTFPGYNEYTLSDGRQLSIGSIFFTDDTSSLTGLHNLLHPWVCILNTSLNYVEFFLFTTRPKNLGAVVENVTNIVNYASSDGLIYVSSDDYIYTTNDSPMITHLVLYRGNGEIFHGKYIYSDVMRDSNSDLIPDVLDVTRDGSITSFIKPFDFQNVIYVSSDNYFYVSTDNKTLEATR